jgi:16S rRNA G966 N2-methylase RsmD
MKHRRDPAAGRGSRRLSKHKQINFAVSLPRPELRNLQTLRPHQHNARTHSKRQIEQIAQSIERFGFLNPVLIDASGAIIAGHGRVEAAKHLGLSRVPTLRIEHLSDAEKRAYILADNKLAEKAGWDREILAIELQALVDMDIEIELTGFEMAEVDLILDEATEIKQTPLLPEDNVPELSAEPPVARRGDLWLLGAHRLYCGDARDERAYDTLMKGTKADFVFTDPPYNVPIDGHVSGLGRIRHREFAMASGEMSQAEYTTFLEKVFRLEALFGRLWNSPVTGYADTNAPLRTPEAPRSEEGLAYCVRLCDGRYFPIQRHSGVSPAQTCSSFCPASATKIYNGSGIDHAVAPDGKRYSELATAFAYRKKIVPGCTCNGRDAFGLVTTPVADDPTLRAGDIVASKAGLMAYSGGANGPTFTPDENLKNPVLREHQA